ncbi:MAG: hypothetical protein V9G04_11165 [Nocardioides sp.]
MATYEYLLTHVEDGVGVIQLNHPEKRNALGWEASRGAHRSVGGVAI